MTSATNIPVHVKKNRTAGDWAILILLIVGGLVMLFPFLVLLLNAFKTTADYNSSGPLSWPKEFSTVGLMKFWNRVNYPEKLWNSIWTSGLVAILAVVLSMFNAFALGIGRVKGRRWIVLLIMLANMLPQEAMLYPLYIMFKKIGLYNSPWAIVIIFTVIQSAFGTYLLSSVYGTFPKSILEAATIDGASRWTIFRKIVFPISKPTLSVMLVFFFIVVMVMAAIVMVVVIFVVIMMMVVMLVFFIVIVMVMAAMVMVVVIFVVIFVVIMVVMVMTTAVIVIVVIDALAQRRSIEMTRRKRLLSRTADQEGGAKA